MSERARRTRRTLAGGVLLVLAAIPVRSAGQQTPPNVAATETQRDAAWAEVRRLDSLAGVRDREYRQLEAAHAAAGGMVDVQEGFFHLRVAPALAEEAKRGARQASEVLAPTLSRIVRTELERRVPVFGVVSQRMRFGDGALLWMAADTGRSSRTTLGLRTTLTGAASGIRWHLVMLAEELAAKRADSTLNSWLRSPRIPLAGSMAHPSPAKRWTEAYVEVAVATSFALRACRDGDRTACLTSLGLTDGHAAGLNDWYAPEDYPALFNEIAVARSDTALAARAAHCRKGDAASCAAAAPQLAPSSIPFPLSVSTRALFLEEVLRTGGPGAYERLLEARGTLRERLAAAAARPLDDVVDRWYARVRAARPAPMAVSPAFILAVCGWCVVFSSIGFTRRSLT